MKRIIQNIVVSAALAGTVSFAACDGDKEPTGEAVPTEAVPVEADKPGTDKPATDKPATETPVADKPATETPVADGEEEPVKIDPLAAPENVAAAPADAKKTKSGLASLVVTKGTGTEHPSAEDTVKVHYTGWTTDGKMFDSSVKRGQPTEFPLDGVIAGWTEGVQLMVVGEKRRFWIPGKLAYGDTPQRPGAPAGTLVFDVELISIKKAVKVKTPADVRRAPADAITTASGLKYKVLTPGTGTKKPAATDRVSVHYSGWTTDGKMFDSSVKRGTPATFPLNRVIPGWTEGVALMVEGEKTRFWIPAALAYGETPQRPGAPAGLLVFDVELIKIL